jgi:hypothetical protein
MEHLNSRFPQTVAVVFLGNVSAYNRLRAHIYAESFVQQSSTEHVIFFCCKYVAERGECNVFLVKHIDRRLLDE